MLLNKRKFKLLSLKQMKAKMKLKKNCLMMNYRDQKRRKKRIRMIQKIWQSIQMIVIKKQEVANSLVKRDQELKLDLMKMTKSKVKVQNMKLNLKNRETRNYPLMMLLRKDRKLVQRHTQVLEWVERNQLLQYSFDNIKNFFKFLNIISVPFL